ncbi:MAG TPA: FHA domain-containing protein, partial [Blastocatellia bacterium]
MKEVALTIVFPGGSRKLKLAEGHLTIGRGDGSDVVIDDAGLSRVHASLHREGDKVWMLDEGSRNGSFINGRAVGSAGCVLTDGDRITVGDSTAILIEVNDRKRFVVGRSGPRSEGASLVPLLRSPVLLVLAAFIVVVGVLAITRHRGASSPVLVAAVGGPRAGEGGDDTEAVNDTMSPTGSGGTMVQEGGADAADSGSRIAAAGPSSAAAPEGKNEAASRGALRYLRLTRDEQADYI